MDIDDIVKRLDELKRTSKKDVEYWYARQIQVVLGYTNWQNFEKVIQKGIMACNSAGMNSERHFIDFNKGLVAGNGAAMMRSDYILSRYACYLIAMNGDSSKEEIGIAQTYFAFQTRKQEIQDQQQDILSEAEKRLQIRERVRDGNRSLSKAARKAGVTRFGIFHDAGYRGLYGGLGVKDIKRRKGIEEKEDFLDRIGRAELAANEFRITQAEEKLIRENIQGQDQATHTHKEVGIEVRKTINTLGGTMPENMPTYESIKKLKRKTNQKKLPSPPK